MKICVYGLVQNIGDRAENWMNHIKDSDYIILGDINSTDNSVESLEKLGATVYKLNIPQWDASVVRNTLLNLIPADVDIAVACDFNQFLSAGWKSQILENWSPGTTKIRCNYHYANNDLLKVERIHSTKKNIKWVRSVDECLTQSTEEQIITTDNLTIAEYFSHAWHDYHELLVRTVNDRPNDGEMIFKLARSFAIHAQWQKAIEFHKLNLSKGDSSLYRSESMIHLSGLEHSKLSTWLAKSVAECSWRREPWYELACYYYRQREWNLCLSHCNKALSLSATRSISKDSERRCLVELNDMASMSAWNSNMMETSLRYAESAANLDPTDPRLHNNFVIIRNIINSKKQNGGHV